MAKKAAAKKGTTRKARAARTPGGQPDRETETRILDAARAVFMRRGTAGARMQEIAREAGVNQALLHYYFRSKERLSSAVFQQFASRLFPALAQTLASDLSIDAKIERILLLYLDNLSQQPFLPGYLISELHHHPERIEQILSGVTGTRPDVLLQPLFARLQAQIDERVAAGEMRPIAAEQLIANLISLAAFPFAARPILSTIMRLDDERFAKFIETRKRELPAFVRAGLRP